MSRFAALLIVCCAAAPGFQEPQNSTVSESDKDAYLIYSLMLTNPETSHGLDNDERYLVAATTAPGRPSQPCVVPPKEYQADFREVLTDYELRKGKARDLKPAFSILKPYSLLPADEVKAFMKERWPTPEPKLPDARFHGVTDLFTLSDVYFNQRHTLALTGMATWCGSLCGSYRWKVFEKLGTGKWEERSWVACMTISDAGSALGVAAYDARKTKNGIADFTRAGAPAPWSLPRLIDNPANYQPWGW